MERVIRDTDDEAVKWWSAGIHAGLECRWDRNVGVCVEVGLTVSWHTLEVGRGTGRGEERSIPGIIACPDADPSSNGRPRAALDRASDCTRAQRQPRRQWDLRRERGRSRSDGRCCPRSCMVASPDPVIQTGCADGVAAGQSDGLGQGGVAGGASEVGEQDGGYPDGDGWEIGC